MRKRFPTWRLRGIPTIQLIRRWSDSGGRRCRPAMCTCASWPNADGSAIAYVMARHRPWDDGSGRFGTMRILLHPELWSGERYGHLVDIAEAWLRDQAAAIAVIRVRADFTDEVRVLQARSYNEVRRGRPWELDLAANRASLLAGAELSRKRMSEQGVRLLTLDRDDDPDRLAKLHATSVEAEQDIPTTVPSTT